MYFINIHPDGNEYVKEVKVQALPVKGTEFEHLEYDKNDKIICHIVGTVDRVRQLHIVRPSEHSCWPGHTVSTSVYLKDTTHHVRKYKEKNLE